MEPEMKIKGETLQFLMELFKKGKVTIGTDKDGFVLFKNGGDRYPIEIYEGGHWDGSLTQALCHTKRKEKTK